MDTCAAAPDGVADDDVVISGMAGYFPGSDNVDELRENLFNGVHLVSEDGCRWNKNSELGVPNATGKIRKPSNFDNAHFGIHRKQVLSLDPLVCLIVERSFEALCDAGVSPASVKGRNIGVYMGSTNSEADNLFDYEGGGDGFGIVGHNRSMLATRVSYYLGINGTSVAEMSSWCAGMTALTNAYRDVKLGHCEAALVGAANLSLTPVMSWHLAQLGLLSPDGKCRPFDDTACGYGRSDGVVVLYLQRASAAKRCYASIVHSDSRCYGSRIQYARPSGYNMARLLTEFYHECGVDPATLAYLEADGAGLKLDDREELNAVTEVLLRNRKSPLMIGSVKSNLGHSEAASGLVSLVKILLSIETGFIPPTLHYKTPNSQVPALIDGRLQVVTETTKWSGGLAAVNCIGIDGNCSHLLLKSVGHKNLEEYDGIPRLVTVCGRTDSGVNQLVSKVQSTPFSADYIRMIQDVHAENIPGHIFRGFTILEPGKVNKIKVQNYPGQKRSVWFVFSGMGSQWPGMGKDLMQLQVFKAAIDRCHALLKPHGLDLIHIITTPDPTIFDNILHCFVGIAAVQIGLTDVLTSLGISPDGMIGHSVGELGCAYADGCMTADEMILSAHARGRASIESDLIQGMMAAVGLGYSQVKHMLPPEVEVACHNGPGSCTLSGPTKPLQEFVDVLTAKGIFARSVNVANIAYHSRHIKPAAPKLLEKLKMIIPTPRPRSSRWISTSVPEERWNSPLAATSSPEYHTNNLLSSVLFEEGSRKIPDNAITIEIAPHGLLQAILKKSLSDTCSHVALTRKGSQQGLDYLLTAIGNLYLLGLQPKVSEIYPPVKFPVAAGTPSISPLISWEHTEDWPILFGKDLVPGQRRVVLSMTQEEFRNYAGHSMSGRTIVPAAAYLKYVWETLAVTRTENCPSMPVVFENVRIHKAAVIPEKGSCELFLLLRRGTGDFEVIEEETKEVHASGRVYVPDKVETEFIIPHEVPREGMHLTGDDVYQEFEHRGYQYRDSYKCITSAIINENGCVSKTIWQNNWVAFITSLVQQSVLQTGEEEQNVQVPLSFQRLVIDPSKHSSKTEVFDVVSHRHSSIILGGGVQIQGLKTIALKLAATCASELHLDTLKFVPYRSPRLQSVKDFVDVSIQLAVENSKTLIDLNSGVTVLENTSDRQTLIPQIEECLSQYPTIRVDIRSSSSKDSLESLQSQHSFLVVASHPLVSQGSKLLGSSGGFLLIRSDNSSSVSFGEEFTVVLEQQFGRGRFLLLRKTVILEHKSPVVIDVDGNDKKWVESLRTTLKTDVGRPVILMTHEVPQCGIKSFVEGLLQESGSEMIRCCFLLDKSIPKFSLKKTVYQEQLKGQLLVNVYQDNTWGSIRHLPLNDDNLLTPEQEELPLPTLTLDGVDLNYIGLNETDSQQSSLGHVDYSGRSGSRRWVMGVARVGSTAPEPLLMWKVPGAWTMEDAATVPFAYSTAYLALVLVGQARSRQRVLIHEGCSAVGQAAIAIAVHLDCRIFTTVADEKQKEYLLKRFPELHSENIFSSKNTKFEQEILSATNFKGVGICLNTLHGRGLQASLRCTASFGNFLQLGRTDMEQNNTIGMIIFNKSVAVYGVASDNLFNASAEWKRLLHDAVQEGIENGVVQPFDSRVFLYQQYDKALEVLADRTQWIKVLLNVRDANKAFNFMKAETIPRLKLEPQGTYLIVGGSQPTWLDLAAWLLRRGAEHIIVSQHDAATSGYVTRHLVLLRKYHRAKITLVPVERAITAQGAAALVAEAEKSRPLLAVFVLNDNRVSDDDRLLSVHHLDVATRRGRLQHFVSLMIAGADSVCLSRRQSGHAGLAVQWRDVSDAGRRLEATLATLDRLLAGTDEHVVVLSQAVERNERHAKNNHGSAVRLTTVLPSDLQRLVQFGEDVTSRRRLEEVRTLSPGLTEVREVPLIFVVPGLSGSAQESLRPLLSQLMYPAVCLKLPRGGASIQNMAEDMAKNVRRLQQNGPYNIVGDSWGGALALEVARSLEAAGEKTHVFLLEGAPTTNQDIFKDLGDGNSMQDTLLCQLLRITDDKERAQLSALSSWEAKLSHALTQLPASMPESQRRLVEVAVAAVYDHVNALLAYRPEEVAMHPGLVTLIRPSDEDDADNCGLFKLCSNRVSVHLAGEGRGGMLSSLQTADVIADNTLVLV